MESSTKLRLRVHVIRIAHDRWKTRIERIDRGLFLTEISDAMGRTLQESLILAVKKAEEKKSS